ncbi:hypothetical protein PVL29_001547 [Vitis rotundifolia]|uniref:WRKY domain-containing protein n=1 Tax=Vitis rotundifolia TaxID=103349 RepID=A0AA39AGK5_VITRO|nr:hypothetical protein PVL29_001547 [Vitis rotundifolia]
MMSEFLGMEDWDLQSVVRGCAINEASSAALMDTSLPCFSPLTIQQDELLFSFPDFFETTTVLDELEQLYKPFYPALQPLSPVRTAADPSISMEDPKKMKEQDHLAGSADNGGGGPGSKGAKPKKSRKSQQKRVVQHVTGEGLSSDVWAWRKYGQKPIKGSPYPRSYYRCSSLKGCLARKQVERSRTDPEIFIVTYTAEHSHSHPTRRNSLAGISRNKFSTPKKPSKAEPPSTPTTVANDSSSSPISTSDLSATTPLMSAMEDELQPYVSQQETGGEEDQKLNERNNTNEVHISDEILNNDFFLGLEDMDFSVQFPSSFPQPWFAATAAGGC